MDFQVLQEGIQTKGTLSKTADNKPIHIATMLILPILLFSLVAICGKIPTDSRDEMLIKIPKKNKILGVFLSLVACPNMVANVLLF